MMTRTLFYKVQLVMILMVVPVRVTHQNTQVLVAQVALNLKLKMNGNKKILKRDMLKEKTDFLFSHYSQEVVQSLVPPKLR
jgi:hypothetical protein